MKTNSEISKTVIVCMVQNAEEYLSEFLTYHLLLVDHVFLIDHSSRYDLRTLNLPDVTVVRSNHVVQFQSECTNLVIEHFNIKKDFDWLFVLDVDEFLPFSEKSEFSRFLKKQSLKKVLRFRWRNGIPFQPPDKESEASLIDYRSLRFFSKTNPNIKSFVNIARIGSNFVVPTGGHHIAYANKPWFSKISLLRSRSVYRSHSVDLPLYHVVALNKEKFVKKIQHYVDHMQYRTHIIGQGGWIVSEYPTELTNEQWYWYVANFRVTDPSLHVSASPEEFIPVNIFKHIDSVKIRVLKRAIRNLKKVAKHDQSKEEKTYLAQKKDDTEIVENSKWFDINNEFEIVSTVPD